MLQNEAKLKMKSEKTRLAIFDTFKTKRKQITGEANRQRAIIHHLANGKMAFHFVVVLLVLF